MRSVNKGILGFFLLYAMTLNAQADVTLESYQTAMSNPKDSDRMRTYIIGVGRGVVWGAGFSRHAFGTAIVCEPDKIGITGQAFLDILAAEIKSPSRKDMDHYPPDAPVELVLINGLVAVYPCREFIPKPNT
jgi:hypothetical protein